MKTTVLFFALFICFATNAQVDTLFPGHTLNVRQENYSISYQLSQLKDGVDSLTGIYRQSLEVNNPAEQKLRFTSVFESNTGKINSKRVSVSTTKTLTPVESSNTAGQLVSRTFFTADSILLKLDSLNGDPKRSSSFKPELRGYDFDLDLPVLTALPLRENYQALIPFYQPGTRSSARYYLYQVTGSESVSFNGKQVDCWKLYSPSYTSGLCTWWISKGQRIVIKEERIRSNGTRAYKSLNQSSLIF